MKLDIRDVQFTSTQPAGNHIAIVTARHIPTGISFQMHGSLDAQDRLALVEYLRVEINKQIKAGSPDKLVRINKDGALRILNGVEGSVFVVYSETESPRGQIVHVTDTAGNVWSLSPDQYEVFEQP